jgi:spermidine synthase
MGMARSVALFLTVLTGFSGLVYQVAWQKVLASLLGSHSEATAAVLALFLGGLSLGYALFGRLSRTLSTRAGGGDRPPGLLPVYGAVEAAIGALALVFPWLFAGLSRLALALPATAPAVSFGFDVALAALLVLPPTILMGGTIPLLTQALSRDVADATRLHSLVYAFNTAGAFAGALAAGFWLVPWLGLDTTIRCMGVVNLAAGIGFVALRRFETAWRPEAATEAPRIHGLATWCSVALLAGFAMMTLQTAANRIGALALGASHFTFAMVVATFVACIALGSFAVAAAPRIRPAWLPASQWALVAVLLVLYPMIDDAPFWAHRLRLHAQIAELGFGAFQRNVFFALFAVALVPLALSGALLPLLFHQLRREAGDLGGVAGRIYAWNTLGSWLGALLGGYWLLFWLDLDGLWRVAILALAAGAALATPRAGLAGRPAAAAAFAGAVAIAALQPAWEPQRLSAGLFRSRLDPSHFADGPDAYFGSAASHWIGDHVLFYTDDPSTTVSVTDFEAKNSRSILVNGKVDGNIPGDNLTAGLAGLLPALFAERAERAFVIGWGTGFTVGELAALGSMREVVVAEISPGVLEAAPFFESHTRGARSSPKVRVLREDAYRSLLRDPARYDVIVSEPSNPWVTGIENLYTLEFLRAARDRLSPGGVYAQWFHLYETDTESVELVLRTYRAAFDQVGVWFGAGSDLILLGFADARTELDLAELGRRWQQPDFNAQLTALTVTSFPRLLAHEVLPLGVVHALPLDGELHTLMHPALSHLAARAFYRKAEGTVPPGVERAAAEHGARHSLVRGWRARQGGPLPTEDRLELLRETCELSRTRCSTLFAQWLHEEPDSPVLAERLARARTDPRLAEALAPEILSGLTALYGRDATVGHEASHAVALDVARVFARFYDHAAPFEAEALRSIWRRCAQTDPRCEAELPRVLALGIGPTVVSSR